ncbi:MAG: sigma-54 dependent transcriptional regulator [Desulfobacteraceae bacterium]|jgi:DNA-binding NtrC family response regulator|nr:sigma-54 dependent transcriptional regulator [Desulfobacteraceae bacterium]
MDDFEILFVDDDTTILNMVEEYLAAFDYRVSIVDSGLKALELIKDKNFDVVFTDFKMPDIDGLELLAMIKEYRPATEVIIVTGHGTMESAIQAMKFGSYDYIQKPFKLDVLKIVINKLYEEKRLSRENIVLRTRVKERHKYDQLVGISLKMQEIYEKIDQMQNGSPNVLIQGESGTGKELTAHVIHRNSERSHLALIPVNCKSFGKGIAGDQMDAHALELFQSAEAGTIFFNEITEIKPADQAVINRVYAENNFNPGADDRNPGSGVRLLAATDKNLEEAARRGILNPDFLRCISEVKMQMPSLRERREDISLLINHFLNQFNAKSDNRVLNVSPEAMDVLLRYNWPGNVIQLENVIERAFALRVDLIINMDDLPSEIITFGEISKMG